MTVSKNSTAYSPGNPHMLTRHPMNAIDWIALLLMIVGGLNWGLVGLLNFDLVAAIFGQMTVAARIVYGLVGLSALYGIYFALKQSAAPRAMP